MEDIIQIPLYKSSSFRKTGDRHPHNGIAAKVFEISGKLTVYLLFVFSFLFLVFLIFIFWVFKVVPSSFLVFFYEIKRIKLETFAERSLSFLGFMEDFCTEKGLISIFHGTWNRLLYYGRERQTWPLVFVLFMFWNSCFML